MREFRIRCSSVGKIMTEPMQVDDRFRTPEVEEIIAKKKRSDEEKALLQSLKLQTLSAGAKTHVRELARAALFGVDKEASSRQMEKGIRCEDDSIALYNSVFFTNHTKNTERRTVGDLTGECDIIVPGKIGKDIKTSWSINSFPIALADCEDQLYEWQMVGYMHLWDVPLWEVAYCLVDTPDDLIGFEAPEAHMVSHIPEHLRVTTWEIQRDMGKEMAMLEKIKAARLYYAEVIAEFDRTHGGDVPIAEAA
jgi:hypothetical protein